MPLAKLTCPKCRATLKPAKPVPEGKSIKCPKCEEIFKAGETAADTRTRTGVQAKKPAEASTAKAPEEDEEAATYAVMRDEEMEKREEERERRKQRKKRKRARDEDEDEDEEEDEEEEEDLATELLRNLKSSDPRGPAQEIVVRPSNWLLRTGLVGFFGWVITFIVFIIPVVFPNIESKEEENPFQAPVAKDKDKDKDKKKAEEKDLAKQIQKQAWSVVLFVFVLLLGLTQAALIAYGAVKLQGLESYRWGMASCILTILPLYMVPLWTFLWWLFDWFVDDYPWGFACVVFAWGPLVGGLCLKEVLRPEVKAGFDYHPD
jgi:hypothetical protein